MSIQFVKLARVDQECLDEEVLLLHPETLEVRVLNETAAVLWDALGEFSTAGDLAGLLDEARPDLRPADNLMHVTTFLEGLAEAGLVERREVAAP